MLADKSPSGNRNLCLEPLLQLFIWTKAIRNVPLTPSGQAAKVLSWVCLFVPWVGSRRNVVQREDGKALHHRTIKRGKNVSVPPTCKLGQADKHL